MKLQYFEIGGIIIKLTINDRILLHLLEYNKYKAQSEVPAAITQKGIAENVGIQLSHVPRGMKQLERAELVVEVNAHVQVPESQKGEVYVGISRKRKAYFLTDNGMALTKKLKSKLEEHQIIFKNLKGQTKPLKLSDLNNCLKENERSNIANQYLFIISEGNGEVFDLRKWKAKLESLVEYKDVKDYIRLSPEILARIPKFRDFFGRKQELKKLKSSIDSDRCKLIIVTGGRGIGKSALASKALEDYKSSKNILWCNIQDSQIFQATINELSNLLGLANRRALKNYLNQNANKPLEINKLAEILHTDLHNRDTLIVIDSGPEIDFNNSELKDLAKFFQNLLIGNTEIKVIITVKIIEPLILEMSALINPKNICTIELEGLDKQSSKKILNIEGTPIDPQEFEAIYHHTKGNPLYLKLIRTIELEPTESQDSYEPAERALLKYLKVVEKLGD